MTTEEKAILDRIMKKLGYYSEEDLYEGTKGSTGSITIQTIPDPTRNRIVYFNSDGEGVFTFYPKVQDIEVAIFIVVEKEKQRAEKAGEQRIQNVVKIALGMA